MTYHTWFQKKKHDMLHANVTWLDLDVTLVVAGIIIKKFEIYKNKNN